MFEESFWDEKYDMFGLLNEAEKSDSMDPADYAARRGRFYLLWNCVKNSGRPMLIALMAGRAAHDVEKTDTDSLLKEIMGKLNKTFSPKQVPAPIEVIVTRWKRDPFTRGTFSYVGPDTNPGDYDVMAAPVGNLHFAGEATCGTHPATVHGAYLSGLRAAGEVVDSMIGDISVPLPLVMPKEISTANETQSPATARTPMIQTPSSRQVKQGRTPKVNTKARMAPAVTPVSQHVNPYRSTLNSRATQEEDHEAAITWAILKELGERPIKPRRPGVNPFLLFTTDAWSKCKADLNANGSHQASRNEIRSEVGRQWRIASDEAKKPYVEKCAVAQRIADQAKEEYESAVLKYDEAARVIRMAYTTSNAMDDKTGLAPAASIDSISPASRRKAMN